MTQERFEEGKRLAAEIAEYERQVNIYSKAKSVSIDVFTGKCTYEDETNDEGLILVILEYYRRKLEQAENDFAAL